MFSIFKAPLNGTASFFVRMLLIELENMKTNQYPKRKIGKRRMNFVKFDDRAVDIRHQKHNVNGCIEDDGTVPTTYEVRYQRDARDF